MLYINTHVKNFSFQNVFKKFSFQNIFKKISFQKFFLFKIFSFKNFSFQKIFQTTPHYLIWNSKTITVMEWFGKL